MKKHYNIDFNFLLQHNKKYLDEILDSKEKEKFIEDINNINDDTFTNKDYVLNFSKIYLSILKNRYQIETQPIEYNDKLDNFINQDKSDIKIIWGDSLNIMKQMKSESIQLMVTSPPYYNAREYSQWDNLDLYLDDMRQIIKESYRVLDNNRVWVWNVGDIFDNDRLHTKSVWGKRRIPLGAYFIKIFEEEGFEFVDDIIWDKGYVESKRHMNNGNNIPFYQYPFNSYEHILIFHKHRLDNNKIPCPICGSLNVNKNTQSEKGVQSWECKNDKCFSRSPSNRGKRFSLRSNMMQYYHDNDNRNKIDQITIKKWQKDIVKINPVIKINNKGKNILGHSAPFPDDIPYMSIKYFTYVGDNVLDPFAGSFTTPLVARKLERNGIGIEINKNIYRDSIINRIVDELNGEYFKELDLL
jgi:DNA modification methylase